jgi:tetratricopeptide (TPR) repeat protein
MKTAILKQFCLPILICVLVVNAMINTLVHASQTITGVQRVKEGITAYEYGEYDEAIFKLEKAKTQILGDDKAKLWEIHFYVGLSHYLLGETDKSRQAFIKAKEIFNKKLANPDNYSPKTVGFFNEANKNNISEIVVDVVYEINDAIRSGNLNKFSRILSKRNHAFYSKECQIMNDFIRQIKVSDSTVSKINIERDNGIANVSYLWSMDFKWNACPGKEFKNRFLVSLNLEENEGKWEVFDAKINDR